MGPLKPRRRSSPLRSRQTSAILALRPVWQPRSHRADETLSMFGGGESAARAWPGGGRRTPPGAASSRAPGRLPGPAESVGARRAGDTPVGLGWTPAAASARPAFFGTFGGGGGLQREEGQRKSISSRQHKAQTVSTRQVSRRTCGGLERARRTGKKLLSRKVPGVVDERFRRGAPYHNSLSPCVIPCPGCGASGIFSFQTLVKRQNEIPQALSAHLARRAGHALQSRGSSCDAATAASLNQDLLSSSLLMVGDSLDTFFRRQEAISPSTDSVTPM